MQESSKECVSLDQVPKKFFPINSNRENSKASCIFDFNLLNIWASLLSKRRESNMHGFPLAALVARTLKIDLQRLQTLCW